MEVQHSPFSINKIELLVVIGTILATWFGLHASISSFIPAGYILETPLPVWVFDKREILFQKWAIPVTSILAISSIFFVRGIRNQKVQYFSRLSHFALALPLMIFPSITLLNFFGLFCFMFVPVFPVLLLVESFKSRKWWGNIFAILWVIGCAIVAMNYFNHIDYLFGD